MTSMDGLEPLFRCGHPRDAANTRTYRRSDQGGHRTQCATCKSADAKAYRARKLAEDPDYYRRKTRQDRARPRATKTTPEPAVFEPAGAWGAEGLCVGRSDADLWFSDARLHQAQAANRCYECRVMMECAQYAVDQEIPYGVWGGLTPKDRGWTNEGKRRSR